MVSVIAWFAIVFTGRYPRALFDFTVGVLRWTWRVAFYSYDALGTDQYPPFSLDAHPDYPATLAIAYPERLSRGLVWVKSWLLAIPQLFIVAILTVGVPPAGRTGRVRRPPALIGLLVFFAGRGPAVHRALRPRPVRPVMGLEPLGRPGGGLRPAASDEYPPFRLDQGAEQPDS